jgi:hypothetical protein
MYEVNTNLTLDVVMDVYYKGNQLNHLPQTNWWVCSFSPKEQFVKIDELVVNIEAAFTNPALYPPFESWRLPRLSETPNLNLNPIGVNKFTILF